MGLLLSHHTPAACNWPGPSSEKEANANATFAMPCMRPSLLRLPSRMDQVALRHRIGSRASKNLDHHVGCYVP